MTFMQRAITLNTYVKLYDIFASLIYRLRSDFA